MDFQEVTEVEMGTEVVEAETKAHSTVSSGDAFDYLAAIPRNHVLSLYCLLFYGANTSELDG
jgi:hypothetical protein